jgi:hypothetical protein
MGDFLGYTYFFKTLPENIAFYSFAKDKAFDLLKEKFTEGLSFLFKRTRAGKLLKADIGLVKDYIASQCKNAYLGAIQYIRQAKPLMVEFSGKYINALKRKAAFNLKIDEVSVADCRSFIDEFPNDPKAEFYEKLLPILEWSEEGDVTSLQKVDVDYFRRVFSIGNEEEKELMDIELDKLQQKKDISIANSRHSAAGWQEYLDKYPNDPEKQIIEKNIKICRENEDMATAYEANSRKKWEEFLERYPDNPHYNTIKDYVETHDFSVPLTKPEWLSAESKIKLAPIAVEAEEGFFSSLLKGLEHVRIP